MTRLLFIQASPRGSASASAQVAKAYIDALHSKGLVSIDLLDVWKEELPPFDGPALQAKYAGLAGQPLNAAQQTAWEAISALGVRFRSADEIIIATPMWNFGVPYRLKHLIDLVTQKDVTFTFDANGFGGMLTGKRAVIACARGLGYVEDTPMSEEHLDYQKAYLITWLNFIGVTEIQTIKVEKTLLGEDALSASLATALAEAKALANSFESVV
jgi:FMN-dependent NADH-azoreductase